MIKFKVKDVAIVVMAVLLTAVSATYMLDNKAALSQLEIDELRSKIVEARADLSISEKTRKVNYDAWGEALDKWGDLHDRMESFGKGYGKIEDIYVEDMVGVCIANGYTRSDFNDGECFVPYKIMSRLYAEKIVAIDKVVADLYKQ